MPASDTAKNTVRDRPDRSVRAVPGDCPSACPTRGMGEIMAGMDCEKPYGILDVERELIAAILADNRTYKAISHLLLPDHFLSSSHQHQFARIADAVERGEPVDFALPYQGGRPWITRPAIDPLDHALMVYGSFLGRAAVTAPAGRSSLRAGIALDESGPT